MKQLALLLLTGLAVLLVPRAAEAQISASIETTKTTYVAYEPIDVVVTITNRAGRDVVLRGRPNNPWLTFQVYDSQGNLISPFRNVKDFEPVLIAAGQTLQRTIPVNTIYPMNQLGIYRVKASVFFPPLEQFYSSNSKALQVSDGREFMRQVVGVPDGRDGAGTYRRFSLMTFNNESEKHLYLRVQDESSGVVLTTFSLGKIITLRDPEWTFDRENRLHILHMGAPRTYAHTIVDAGGQVIGRDVYRENAGARPALVNAGQGDVVVQGGVAAEDEKRRDPLQTEVRKLSERPATLPRQGNAGLLR